MVVAGARGWALVTIYAVSKQAECLFKGKLVVVENEVQGGFQEYHISKVFRVAADCSEELLACVVNEGDIWTTFLNRGG